jgi:VWFA-related protein
MTLAPLLAALHAAPQASPSPKAPVFPSAAELVTVDVVVVDADGHPVPGLGRGDFTVLEDGTPREIATFEEVRVPEAPAAAAPSAATARPRASTNAGPPPARTFVIVFDELDLTTAGAERAKAVVASFLKEGLRPGDRVTLVPTAAGRSWTDTMPEGRADLLALLDKMTGRRPMGAREDHVTDWEALRIQVHRDEHVESTVLRRFYENGAIPNCVPPDIPGARACDELQRTLEGSPRVKLRAAEVYVESLARRRTVLGVLEATLDALARVKGRKSVLFVSEGFVLEPTLTEMHAVYEAARRANTAVNFVDARGLFPVDTTIVDAAMSPTQPIGSRNARPSNDLGLALDSPRLLAEGSQALADETGGQTYKNSNDLRAGFDQLARESTVYYLVGYAPGDLKRDGKFRRIEVRVARPKAAVHARRGYVVPREVDLRRAEKDAAPSPLGDAGTLPLRVAAYALDETAGGTVRVVFAGEADASVFGWEPKEDRFEDALDTTLNVAPRGGTDVKSDTRLVELRIPAPTREQVERTWLPILREVELRPGIYQAHLAVRERNAGRIGVVRHALEVPAPGTFRMTTPILTDLMQPAAPGAAAPRLSPVARRAFAQGARLFCSFDVLNAAKDTQSQTRVRAGHVLRRADGTALSKMDPSPLPPGADGRLTRTLAISLRTATPGPHELALTVLDEVSGRTVETVEAFEVTPATIEAAAPPPPADAPTVAPPPLAPPVAGPAAGPRLVEPRAALQRADREARGNGPQARRWGVAAALLLDALGRTDEATGRLKALLRESPRDADALLALGAIEESHLQAAVARPLEATPAGSESLPKFQRNAVRERVLREAEERYRAVLAVRPGDEEARLRLGRVLQLRGEREAVQHLEEVSRSANGDRKALALLFLGEARDAAGSLAGALTSYRQAAAAAPHSQTATLALAQALLRNGDPKAARDTVEKGLLAQGLDPYLTYMRPALRLGSELVGALETEATR